MMNQVNLVGRTVQSPEITYLQDGKAITRFTLAVQRDYKDKDGNRPADFIRCVIWGTNEESNKATVFADFVKQGDLVDINGRIETRSFEGQDGNQVYVTEINVRDFHFLAKKSESSKDQSNQSNQSKQSNRNDQRKNYNRNKR